tara:strand:- start:1145 stop:1357 length:213 start_codon:yes stop_codon:yes gene_type:complete
MNGSKAKKLRGLAAVTKETQENRTYHADSNTVRTKNVKGADGAILWSYKTATLKLDAGARLLYKMLKKAA